MEYTIAMGLEDFLPVIFSGIGLYFVVHMIGRFDKTSGRMAFWGAFLIILGGVFKASWKLNIAATGQDIVWMADSLFLLLGPGFTLLSWALFSAQLIMAGKDIPRMMWLRPLLVIALFVVGAAAASTQGGRTWIYIMLTLTTFANLAVVVLLIKQSNQQGVKTAAGLFLFNIIAVFALSGMARMPQTVSFQWIEQGLQTLSQGAFAIAAYQLAQDTARRFNNVPVSS
ncbi:MAG: hypothetical protein KDE48_19565 [Anaerolineales bacterium]|nr:hypothetical protein [Anaerolineales bacterium]